jgi:hypothetical protein
MIIRIARYALAASVLACPPNAAAQTGRAVRELPPIALVDTGAASLTSPRALAVGPDGGFYVVDYASARVIQFASSGGALRLYGSRGDGPGELQTPLAVRILDDTMIAVTDWRRRDVSFFHRTQGRFLSRLSVAGPASGITGTAARVWVGVLNLSAQSSVEEITPPTGGSRASVAPPAIYKPSSPATQAHGQVFPLPVGERLIVGFAATDFLLAVTTTGQVDTIRLPIAQRRGVPPNLEARYATIRGPGDYYEMLSALVALERGQGGTIVAVHADASVGPGATFGVGPGAQDPFTYTVFVSVLGANVAHVCADVRIPLTGETAPAVAVRGDTLLFVDQAADGDAHPWKIRRFVVSPAMCPRPVLR